MYRLTINLSDDVFEKLKIQANNKNLSLSHYGHVLIESSLRIEQATFETETAQFNQIAWMKRMDDLGKMKKILKNLLTWQLESRYLTRHLVEKLFEKTQEPNQDILAEAKKIARRNVNKLVDDQADSKDF